MNRQKKTDKKVFQALILVSQFGINMLVPMGLMLWLGIWLDEKLQTSWLTILCFFVGAIAGFQNIYKMSRNLMQSDRDEIQMSVDNELQDRGTNKE